MWRRLARWRRCRWRRSCWGQTGPAAPISPARRKKGRTCGERPGRGDAPSGPAGRAAPRCWASRSVTVGQPASRGRLRSTCGRGLARASSGPGRASTPLRCGRAVRRPRWGPAGGVRRGARRGAAAGLGPRRCGGGVRGRSGSYRAGTAGMGSGRLRCLFLGAYLLKTAVTEEKCVSEIR